MLDISHIPNSQQDIKIFYSNGITNAWQTWVKPRKCQWVWIMCIGSGAGGGAGFTTFSQGWSGAGSGAVTRALFNASHLPDTLYIQVGIGGKGATGGNGASPTAGTKSYISILPNITTTNLVVTSGATAASTAGAPETAATSTNMIFATLGNFISTAGSANPGISVNTPALTSTVVTNGGYSGIQDQVYPQPTSIQSSSISPLIRGGLGPVSGPGGNGANGITSWKPFFSLGGAGGGASTDGTGGNGGNGGIGSGGGSGGGGPVAGGNGGNGGDGLVMIVTF